MSKLAKTLISGKVFNKLFRPTLFVKLTIDDSTFSHEEKLKGWGDLDPYEKLFTNGYHFTDLYHMPSYLDDNTYNYRTLSIGDQASVYITEIGDYWVDDKDVIFSSPVPIHTGAFWKDPIFCKLAVDKNDYALKFVDSKIYDI